MNRQRGPKQQISERDIGTYAGPPAPPEARLHDILALALSSSNEPESCETAAYLSELDSLDMDPADKTELIHTLWRLIETLIRIRFGLDPALDATIAHKTHNSRPKLPVIKSGRNSNTEFGEAARGTAED